MLSGTGEPVSKQEFAARLNAVAAGIRHAQQARNQQRSAGQRQALILREDLAAMKDELAALRRRLLAAGKDIIADLAAGFQEVCDVVSFAEQHREKQELSVFLASQKHVHAELLACKKGVQKLRNQCRGDAWPSSMLAKEKANVKRETELILSAVSAHVSRQRQAVAEAVRESEAEAAALRRELVESQRRRSELEQKVEALEQVAERKLAEHSSLSRANAQEIVRLQTQLWKYEAEKEANEPTSKQVAKKVKLCPAKTPPPTPSTPPSALPPPPPPPPLPQERDEMSPLANHRSPRLKRCAVNGHSQAALPTVRKSRAAGTSQRLRSRGCSGEGALMEPVDITL